MEKPNTNPAPVTNAKDFMKAIGVTSLRATFANVDGVQVDLKPDGEAQVTDIPRPRTPGIRPQWTNEKK